jgi:hypothetical protein
MIRKPTTHEYTFMAVSAVPCDMCGAKVGEHCHGRNGKEWRYSNHVGRKHAMTEFRKRLPQQYADMRDGILAAA